LAWRVWPARDRPGKAAFAGAVIIAFAALITSWCLLDGVSLALSIVAGAGSLAVVFLTLNRFFLPSLFEIDEQGLTAQHPIRRRRIEWKDVRRFLHDEHGGYLARRAVSSRFDSWQGVHLLFDEHPERAIAAIRERIASAREAEGKSQP
jgi:hypothetical protein